MKRTLQDQIQANKRASLYYAFLLVVLLALMGAAIVGYKAPQYWMIGAAGSAVLGIVMVWAGLASAAKIVLQISHARDATPLERQVLDNVTEEMALAAGIPKPEVYLIDDSAPNAFATGLDPRHGVIVVTTGLLRKLDRDELQGVVAHEMSHIRNYDVRLMTTLAIVAGLIPMLADLFLRSTWFGRGSRSNDRDNAGAAVWLVIGLALAILAPLFAKLLELAVSRKREYLADATAAELTRYPEGLARALEKISGDQEVLESANRATAHMYIVNPFKSMEQRAQSLFSTHPPIQARIQALHELMGNMPRGAEAPPVLDTK